MEFMEFEGKTTEEAIAQSLCAFSTSGGRVGYRDYLGGVPRDFWHRGEEGQHPGGYAAGRDESGGEGEGELEAGRGRRGSFAPGPGNHGAILELMGEKAKATVGRFDDEDRLSL